MSKQGFAMGSIALNLQEAYLISSMLGQGLTSLRKEHVHDKGSIYIGLFTSGIGIERLLKIVIIARHIELSGKPPPFPQ